MSEKKGSAAAAPPAVARNPRERFPSVLETIESVPVIARERKSIGPSNAMICSPIGTGFEYASISLGACRNASILKPYLTHSAIARKV